MTFDGKFMYTMIQICQRLNFMYQTLKHDENNIQIYDELDINQINDLTNAENTLLEIIDLTCKRI